MNIFFCVVVSQTVHLEGIREVVLDSFKFRVHKFALLLKEINIYTSDLLVGNIFHFCVRFYIRRFYVMQESWAKALQAELEQQQKQQQLLQQQLQQQQQQQPQQQSITVPKSSQQQQARYNYQIKVPPSDTLKPPASPKQYRAVNTVVISNTNANTTNASTTTTSSQPPANSNVVNGVELTS